MPAFVTFVEALDGFLEVGVPVFFVTTVVFLAALAYLLLQAAGDPQVRYISLFDDYFAAVAVVGHRPERVLAEARCQDGRGGRQGAGRGPGPVSIPCFPQAIDPLFFGHLFLVCVLVAYFPFSKLVHMAGVFLSPTRNLANNNRMVRHVNPWDYPVKMHPYAEYEDELEGQDEGGRSSGRQGVAMAKPDEIGLLPAGRSAEGRPPPAEERRGWTPPWISGRAATSIRERPRTSRSSDLPNPREWAVTDDGLETARTTGSRSSWKEWPSG